MAYGPKFARAWVAVVWGFKGACVIACLAFLWLLISGRLCGCTLHVHFGERHYTEPQRVETSADEGLIVEIDP